MSDRPVRARAPHPPAEGPQQARPADAQRAQRRADAQAARTARILEAARAVLAEDGISGLTMRAVAARAGYTAGAVYAYFASKEALLATLAVDEMEAVARQLRGMDGRLETMAPVLVRALRKVVPLLTAARRGDVPEAIERALTGRIIRVLHDLDAACAPGGLRAEGPSGAAADTLALWSALTGLALLAWSGRFDSLSVPEEEVIRALAARFGQPLGEPPAWMA